MFNQGIILMKSFFAKSTALLTLILAPSFVFAQTSLDPNGPIIGTSEGNHRLDCTIIRPWATDLRPEGSSFPVIGWTNGWGQGNVHGADQILGYDGGLFDLAEAGDYIVVAANQWSARSPDILQCLQWLLDENIDSNSEYFEAVNTDQIGVSGHSQGGGAALKAGNDCVFDGANCKLIKTVVAMNPYGPSFVKARGQNGQILVLGGTNDGVTPTNSFSAVLNDSILSEDMGGVQAELIGGSHCNPACDFVGGNFGEFGEASLLWFDMVLKGEDNCAALETLFENGEWNPIYSVNFCP
ncbi:MAG: dienelactone hydrolase [Lysobacterales bacterium]